MKILYITRKYPPSIGGMQTQSFQFYKSLSFNNEVILISWRHPQIFLPVFFVAALCKAVFILLKEKIDIIQLGDLVLSPLGLLLKIIFNKPVLTISHGRDSAFQNVFYDLFILGAAKRLDTIIGVSKQMCQRLITRGFMKTKLKVIPNGIDIDLPADRFLHRKDAAIALEKKIGVNLEKNKVIITLCRLVPKKGVKEFIEDIFVDLSNKNEDISFIIAGDGPEKKNILRLIDKYCLHDRIHLTGYIEHGSLFYRSLFSLAGVFIMPNIAVKDDAEGFGVVILEAALWKVPVIAYNVDGINEALHSGKNGILIKERDSKAFKDNILLFLNTPVFKNDFAEEALKYTKDNFNWDKVIQAYLFEYNRLITQSNNILN